MTVADCEDRAPVADDKRRENARAGRERYGKRSASDPRHANLYQDVLSLGLGLLF